MHRPRRLIFVILLIITAFIGCEKAYTTRPEPPPPAPSDTSCVDPEEDDDDKD